MVDVLIFQPPALASSHRARPGSGSGVRLRAAYLGCRACSCSPTVRRLSKFAHRLDPGAVPEGSRLVGPRR